MKIVELEIENFGVFSNRRLHFEPGLQILHGPNETGKTTLLELIRQLLFGFPHRNPYAIDTSRGKLCAKATLTLADGQQVWFRRRKGRPDHVAGELVENGKSVDVDENMLTAVLGNANASLYNNVFGFSLSELAAGTESLRDANLTEAFYGGGVGGLSNMHQVRTALASEAKRLYNTRSKKSEIYDLLLRLEEEQAAWRDAQISPNRYKEMVAQRIEADQMADRWKTTLDALRAEREKRQRLLDAHEPYQQWRAACQQFETLPALEASPEASRDFETLQRQIGELESHIKTLRTKLQSTIDQLGQLPPDEVYQPHADLIRELHQQVARLRNFREEIPLRRNEAESLRDHADRDLRAMQPEWSVEIAESLQLDFEQQESLKQFHHQQNQFSRELAAARARVKQVREQRDRCKQTLESQSGCEPDPTKSDRREEVAQLVEQIAEHEGIRRELEENLTEQRQQLRSSLDRLAQRMIAITPDWPKRPLRSRAPTNDQIRIVSARWDELVARRAEIDRRLRAGDQMERSIASAQNAVGDSTTPTLEDQRIARKYRDQGLELIRRVMTEDTDDGQRELTDWQGEHTDPWLAMRAAIAAVDRLDDTMIQSADEVFEQAERARETEELARERTRCLQLSRWCDEGTSRLQSLWQALWEPCELQPGAPRQMEGWLANYQDWCEVHDNLQRADARAKTLESSLEIYYGRWQAALPPEAACDLELPAAGPQWVHAGRIWWETEQTKYQQREEALRELPKIEKRLEEEQAQLDECNSQLAEWTDQWSQFLGRIDFPKHWDPDAVQRILPKIDGVRSRLKQAAIADAQAAQMQTTLDEADSAVRALRSTLDAVAASAPIDAAIEQLFAMLQNEQRSQNKRAVLEQQQRDTERELTERNQSLQAANESILQLQRDLNANDRQQLQARLTSLKKREGLHETMQRSRKQLELLAAQAGEDDDAFLEQLATVNVEELRETQRESLDQLKGLEEQLDIAQRAAGAAAAALEQLVEATDATQRARIVAADRARLSHLVDRWAPTILASHLLEMSLDRFERENQPVLLRETAELFRQLTGGRYVDVRRVLDEKQSLVVEDASGELKSPDQLSRGTREQLYLAIRLAYVRQYCRRSEPLPIVMDDIFVNFDDDRAAHALATLKEIAADQQILFLTCHHRMAAMAGTLGVSVQELVATDRKARGGKASTPRVAKRVSSRDDANTDPQRVLFPRD